MMRSELKDLSYVEANSELSNEEFKEWRELRKESLLESANENRVKWAKRDAKAENELLEIGESSVRKTVEVDEHEIEVKLLLNRTQRHKIRELMSYRNEFDGMTKEKQIEKMDDIEDFFCEFLSDICPNYSVNEFKEYADKRGLPALNQLGGKLIRPLIDEFSKKNQESKNTQGEKE